MENKLVAVGLTLFSVLQKQSKKYVINYNGYENYVKELFSEERLDLKSDIFFNLSLPQLNVMDKSSCSYIHYLVYSKELPNKYKVKIKESVTKYSFLRAIEVVTYEQFNIKEELKKVVTPGENFALFGLDDDDLLSIDYLQILKNYIKKEFIGFNVVLSKGFTGLYNDGLSNCRELRFPFINIGQARICNRDLKGIVHIHEKGSHMKTDLMCPTIIDSRSATFFWFRHLVQDTFSKTDLNQIIARINLDLDNYSYPSESITEKFPILKNVIKDENLSSICIRKNILLSNRKEIHYISKEGDNLILTGNIVIKYLLKNITGSSAKQAIIVFNLSKSLSTEEIIAAGFAKSNIGYYRYFNTNSSIISGSFKISLPKDVSIVSIEAMKWGNESILIESIEIFNDLKI